MFLGNKASSSHRKIPSYRHISLYSHIFLGIRVVIITRVDCIYTHLGEHMADLKPEQSCHSVIEKIPAKVRASSGFFPSKIATAYAPVKQSPAPVVSTTCVIEQPLLHHPEPPIFAIHCPMLYDRQHAWIATFCVSFSDSYIKPGSNPRKSLLVAFILPCLP